jgi:hypothetical protein
MKSGQIRTISEKIREISDKIGAEKKPDDLPA